MRSFAIVIRRAYFEAKKRRKYAKNVVVNRSGLHMSKCQIVGNPMPRLNYNNSLCNLSSIKIQLLMILKKGLLTELEKKIKNKNKQDSQKGNKIFWVGLFWVGR